MANYRTTIAADTAAAQITFIDKPRSLTSYFATLNAYGTFGSGTLSYLISTDGGTTKTTVKTISGTAYSATAADAVNIATGVANHLGKEPILYAALTGSTNPSITIDVLDNT